MNIRVQPDPAHPAGHALIHIDGAAVALHAPGFRVQRPDWEDDKLGLDGWQSSDVLLQPERAEASGADLILHIGWNVCRHLEEGVYEISVPAAGQGSTGVSWPDIAPVHAGFGEVIPLASPPIVAPTEAPPGGPATQAELPAVKSGAAPGLAPPAAARQPAFVTEPSPNELSATIGTPTPAGAVEGPSAPPPPLRSAAGQGAILVACLLLVLLLSGGVYYYWPHRDASGATAARVAVPETAPSAGPVAAPIRPPAPASLSGLSIPDVLARAPNAAAITIEGNRRLHAGHPDDGLLLLEAAGNRADPGAAAVLARLYDPVIFQPGGPIPQPDPRQAARYYRDAANGGIDVTAAREALRQNLRSRAQGGDLGADLTLKDFWP
jgi:hypothetical protein